MAFCRDTKDNHLPFVFVFDTWSFFRVFYVFQKRLGNIEFVKQIVDIDLVGLFDIDPIIGHPDFFGHKFYAVQISLHIQISYTFTGRICIKSYPYVNIPNDNRPFCLFLERCKYNKMIVSVLFYCRKFLIAVENSFIVYISSLCV